VCGGVGYFVENWFFVLKVDIDVFMIFEGDNIVFL